MLPTKLKKVREGWIQMILENYNEKVASELMRIDKLEQEAWQAWYRSCKDLVDNTTYEEQVLRAAKEIQGKIGKKDGIVDTKSKLTTVKITKKKVEKGQSGNSNFLNLVTWCIEMRTKLLNLIKKDDEGGDTKQGMFIPDWNILSQDRPKVFIDPADVRIAELEESITVPNTVKEVNNEQG